MKKELILIPLMACLIFSCNKSKDTGLVDLETQKKLKATVPNSTNGFIDNLEGCVYVSWNDPNPTINYQDTTIKKNINNFVKCWTSKPKWWPCITCGNTGMYADWQKLIHDTINRFNPRPVQLGSRNAALALVLDGINRMKNSSPSPNPVPLPNTPGLLDSSYRKMEDYFTTHEIDFLDNQFSLQTLVFDQCLYQSRKGLATYLFDSESQGIAQTYVSLKAGLFDRQNNFFGYVSGNETLRQENYYAKVLSDTKLKNTIYDYDYITDRVNKIAERLNSLPTPVPGTSPTPIQNKMLLPRWYFYFFLTDAELTKFIYQG